jgi:sialic acid synthase SpsE
VLTRDDLEVLRPAPVEAVPAHELGLVIGRAVGRDLAAGEDVRWGDLLT